MGVVLGAQYLHLHGRPLLPAPTSNLQSRPTIQGTTIAHPFPPLSHCQRQFVSSENHLANIAKAPFSTKLQFICISLHKMVDIANEKEFLILTKIQFSGFRATIVCNFVLACTSTCRFAEAKVDKMQMVVIRKYCLGSSSSAKLV